MHREFFVDGQLIDWHKLIEMAAELDRGYKGEDIQFTSEAASILKIHGHKVEYKVVRDADQRTA